MKGNGLSRAPLRVLLLGCGYAARVHSGVLRRMPGVELSYASRDAARAAATCARFGGVTSWGSYEEGLADPAVQIALIATPTSTHRDLALLALGAACHVIVEKPAFLRSADVDPVRDAAVAAGRHVFVAENYVYKPLAAELRDTIGAGMLGDVRFVSLNATKWQPAHGWRADPALSGGGALFEAGIHWISFAARLGLDLTSVHGARSGPAAGADRSSLVTLRYANGACGTLAHSWELPAPFGGARFSTVQGTRGAVTFESNGVASVTTGRMRRLRVHARDTLGYGAMLADFIAAVRDDRQAAYTLDMAQRDLAWLEVAQAGVG